MGESQGQQNPILRARSMGIEQALAGLAYDPPIWIRESELYRQAYLRGYNFAAAAILSILPR